MHELTEEQRRLVRIFMPIFRMGVPLVYKDLSQEPVGEVSFTWEELGIMQEELRRLIYKYKGE